jgi:hypothetical protein
VIVGSRNKGGSSGKDFYFVLEVFGSNFDWDTDYVPKTFSGFLFASSGKCQNCVYSVFVLSCL